MDLYQVIFHPVWADERVQYPSHFKRFEILMFAFAEDKDNLSHQVLLILSPFFKNCSCTKLSNSSCHTSVYFLQAFVHCDVVICDARNPLAGACNRLCSNQENKIKGMLFGFREANVFSLKWLRLFIFSSTGQRRAVSDGQSFEHVSSGPILIN